MNRYLDDFNPGELFKAESFTLNETEIIDFARQYDPQPFHTEIETAKGGPYGGLISSGFQTLALCFCQMVKTGVFDTVSMGGPSMDEVKFSLPVRPGDTIYPEAEIQSIKHSRSKPDRGIMHIQYRGFNQNGDEVISFVIVMIGKRKI
jgi:acyl dehydratase